jgi:hypothetical protein
MVNKWVEHIRAFAKKNGQSYGCALSDPKCKSSYHDAKGVPDLETPMRTSRVIKANPPKVELSADEKRLNAVLKSIAEYDRRFSLPMFYSPSSYGKADLDRDLKASFKLKAERDKLKRKLKLK